ncbi:hypothetical protein, partial [Pseudomonas viridiflava]
MSAPAEAQAHEQAERANSTVEAPVADAAEPAPAVETTIAETTTVETTAVEAPTEQAPVAVEPTVEQPAVEAPVADETPKAEAAPEV